MKFHTDDSPRDLKRKSRFKEKKAQNENLSELTPIPLYDVLISGTKESEGEPNDKSTRRALELSRKGIFACPKFTPFFNDDEDDVRIC